eukprot:7022746-Pyramimonas_sp.AAC.1
MSGPPPPKRGWPLSSTQSTSTGSHPSRPSTRPKSKSRREKAASGPMGRTGSLRVDPSDVRKPPVYQWDAPTC